MPRAFRQVPFEPGQSFRRVTRQAVGIGAIFLQPQTLAIEILKTLFRRFELTRQCGHAVAVRGSVIASVGQFVAGLSHHCGGGGLGFLCEPRRLLRFRHAQVGGLGLFLGRVGRHRRIAPPGKN